MFFSEHKKEDITRTQIARTTCYNNNNNKKEKKEIRRIKGRIFCSSEKKRKKRYIKLSNDKNQLYYTINSAKFQSKLNLLLSVLYRQERSTFLNKVSTPGDTLIVNSQLCHRSLCNPYFSYNFPINLQLTYRCHSLSLPILAKFSEEMTARVTSLHYETL